MVESLRNTILQHLPEGYEEGMQYGMVGYYVPFSRLAETYNGQPLGYVGLGNQKNYVSLHLNYIYTDEDALLRLQQGFREAGKKLDMGKSCLRFKKPDSIPHDVIGEAVASLSVDEYIEIYQASRG